MIGSWLTQSTEYRPTRVFSGETVGGVAYLMSGVMTGGTNNYSVLECHEDGSIIEYDLGATQVDITPMSSCVAGTKIVFTETTTGNQGKITVFDTVAKTVARFTSSTIAASFPRWSKGAQGPDGLCYFPQVRSGSGWTGQPTMAFNPSTNAITFPTFGGTWQSNYYHGAVMGGDGYMYFLPGYETIAGGAVWTGTNFAILDFGTMTVTNQANITGNPTVVWAQPSPTGIVYGVRDGRIYSRNSTGPTLIGDVNDIYPDGDGNFPYTYSSAVGSDGLVYAVGHMDVDVGTTPFVIVVDPVAHDTTFVEVSPLTGASFYSSITYAAGDKIFGFPYWVASAADYPSIFETTQYTPVPPGPAISYAHGYLPVTLAHGYLPVTGQIG